MTTWKYLGLLAGGTIAAYGLEWGVIAAGWQFGWEPLKGSGPVAILWMVSVALYVGLLSCWLFFILGDRRRSASGASGIVDVMIQQLRLMSKNGEFQRVVRFGNALSRPLWLEGERKARIQVGKIVAKAAPLAPKSDKRALVIALIDDIGWTYATLREFNEAKESIDRGLEVAAKSPTDHYLMAKALRHKGGIAVQQHEFDIALKYLDEAAKTASLIKEALLREEMIAGIEHGFSEAYKGKHDFQKAEDYCISAKRKFESLGDEERVAKTFAVRGNILEHLGRDSEARNSYAEGLECARQVGRRDEIVRNLRGLARIMMDRGRFGEAKECLEEAAVLSQGLPIAFEDGSIEDDLKD